MLSLTPAVRDSRTQPRQSTSPEPTRRAIIEDVRHAKSTARRDTTGPALTLQFKSKPSATTQCRADTPSFRPTPSRLLLHVAGRELGGGAPTPCKTGTHDPMTPRASEGARATLRRVRERAAELHNDKSGLVESYNLKNMDTSSRVNQLIRLTLLSFGCWNMWAGHKTGQTRQDAAGTTSGGKSQVTSTDKSQRPSNGGTKKRTIQPQSPSDNGDGDEDEEDRDQLPERPHKKRLVEPDSQLQNLACPFYKFAPAKHYQCGRLALSKISYVKQHILRRHAHIYCMRCHKEFERPEKLENHHRSTDPCELAPEDVRPPGISLSQRELLGQRSLHGRAEDEKWCDIWRIIFPGKDPPLSVYIDPELPEEVNWFRDNMATQVSQNLRGKIEKKQPELVNHSEALVKSVLDFMTEISLDWKKQWTEEMEERSIRQTPRPIPVRDSDPAL